MKSYFTIRFSTMRLYVKTSKDMWHSGPELGKINYPAVKLSLQGMRASSQQSYSKGPKASGV